MFSLMKSYNSLVNTHPQRHEHIIDGVQVHNQHGWKVPTNGIFGVFLVHILNRTSTRCEQLLLLVIF